MIIEINNIPLEVEIADDNSEKTKGLMYREQLPQNTGMLFIFDSEDSRSFWMKNTQIPLDIAFIGEDLIIKKIDQLDPVNDRSVEYAKYVLEVNMGWFSRNGITEGAKVSFSRKASAKKVARMYLADLNPGLGRSDSPCDLMRRIEQEVENPRQKDKLLELVEEGHDLGNSEAHIIYDPIIESGYGKSKFKRIEITPHAQYRMDLRGVDVKELNSALFEFQKIVQRDISQKGWSHWEDQLEEAKVTYVDSSGLKVVFEPLFYRDVPSFDNLMGAVVVTAFYKGVYPKQLTRTDCGL